MSENVKSVSMVKRDTELWKDIFKLGTKGVDLRKPLTPKILSDPDHVIVKTIVYIYSMESFIFHEMNKTSRTKDESKI